MGITCLPKTTLALIAIVVLLSFAIFFYLHHRRQEIDASSMDSGSWLLVGLSLVAVVSVLAFILAVFFDGFTC
jgi:hypothetical protein